MVVLRCGGDYDNDNDLDILLAGRTGEDLSENLRTTKLYRERRRSFCGH